MALSEKAEVQILDTDDGCPELPIVEGSGVARAVVWPGVGATMRSMHRISLSAGARTVPLMHPMEAVYYVIEGAGRVYDESKGTHHAIEAGSMVFVEPATTYVLAADEAPVEFVGGPCPPDPALYRHLDGG